MRNTNKYRWQRSIKYFLSFLHFTYMYNLYIISHNISECNNVYCSIAFHFTHVKNQTRAVSLTCEQLTTRLFHRPSNNLELMSVNSILSQYTSAFSSLTLPIYSFTYVINITQQCFYSSAVIHLTLSLTLPKMVNCLTSKIRDRVRSLSS